MIKVTVSKSKKGHRLVITNANGKKFNDFYAKKSNALRAWQQHVRQIQDGKFTVEPS